MDNFLAKIELNSDQFFFSCNNLVLSFLVSSPMKCLA